MPAAVDRVLINELSHGSVGPAFESPINIFRKDAVTGGKVELGGPEGTVKTLPIEPSRIGPCVRQPVQHEIVEHLIVRQSIFRHAFAIGPFLKLLVDPCGLRDRRVRQPITERLRAARLLRRIARSQR